MGQVTEIPKVLRVSVLSSPTALIKIFVENKFIGFYRALGDTGAHPNIVTHNVIKKGQINTSFANGSVIGISNNPMRICRKLTLSILPWFIPDHMPKLKATFHVLPRAVQWKPIFPACSFSSNELTNDLDKPLADPLFWKSERTDLIFGIELFAEIVEGCTRKLDSCLVSQQSAFGHWIYGRIGESDSEQLPAPNPRLVHVVDLKELDQSIQKFWEFEDLNLCTTPNAEHELIETMFKQTHQRDENGRFIIEIPLKPQVTELGSSREAALRRFFMLEKRFKRDPEFREKYVEFMTEYEQLGHMVEVSEQPKPGEMCYHIPHHGVVSSTKFRVVFDGSCKTNLGISLNDIQFVGPKLQRDHYAFPSA